MVILLYAFFILFPNFVLKVRFEELFSVYNILFSFRDKQEKLLEKLANAEYPFCEEVSKYEKLAKIGQGTFG